jgi:hypothetical protein
VCVCVCVCSVCDVTPTLGREFHLYLPHDFSQVCNHHIARFSWYSEKRLSEQSEHLQVQFLDARLGQINFDTSTLQDDGSPRAEHRATSTSNARVAFETCLHFMATPGGQPEYMLRAAPKADTFLVGRPARSSRVQLDTALPATTLPAAAAPSSLSERASPRRTATRATAAERTTTAGQSSTTERAVSPISPEAYSDAEINSAFGRLNSGIHPKAVCGGGFLYEVCAPTYAKYCTSSWRLCARMYLWMDGCVYDV